MTAKSKEAIYDESIFPLMEKVIAICKEHKIAVLASFSIPTADDDSLQCTTALLEDDSEPPKEMIEAYHAIMRGSRRQPAMITVRDADGKIISSTAIL